MNNAHNNFITMSYIREQKLNLHKLLLLIGKINYYSLEMHNKLLLLYYYYRRHV